RIEPQYGSAVGERRGSDKSDDTKIHKWGWGRSDRGVTVRAGLLVCQ
ncbi:hypothetical protein MNBD_GAMMA14-1692, partial [hydrothermal vent metagenome]